MSIKSAPRGHVSPSVECAGAVAAVRALVGALNQSARVVEERTGLTNAQLFLLMQLASEGALSVNDLAARAMTRQSTVSILATRLERTGFLKRARSEEDARRVMLDITAAGRRLLRRAPEPPLANLIDALCQLTTPERAALDRGLGALLRELGVNATSAPPMFERGLRKRIQRA